MLIVDSSLVENYHKAYRLGEVSEEFRLIVFEYIESDYTKFQVIGLETEEEVTKFLIEFT